METASSSAQLLRTICSGRRRCFLSETLFCERTPKGIWNCRKCCIHLFVRCINPASALSCRLLEIKNGEKKERKKESNKNKRMAARVSFHQKLFMHEKYKIRDRPKDGWVVWRCPEMDRIGKALQEDLKSRLEALPDEHLCDHVFRASAYRTVFRFRN